MVLNLALSSNVEGGYGAGRIVNIVGDSHAGKSVLALTGLAEVACDAAFDEYLLLYYDQERAQAFNIEKMFGKKLLRRLEEAWSVEQELMEMKEYLPPVSIQDFYRRVLQHIENDKPFICILDSFDAISSEEELDRAEKFRVKGDMNNSYKMEKARWASEIFRVLSDGLSNTASLLIVISQTRDNIDPMSHSKKTRAGGRALEFYASHIFWLSKMQSLTKGDGARKTKIGRIVQAKITKTKLTGFEGDVKFPIYRQIGVDDSQAAIDFLLEWHDDWAKAGNSVECKKLGLKGMKMNICKQIDEDYRDEIKQQLQEAWDAYMEASAIDRKCRFNSDSDL